ncbi:UNVERIFIED_ORG: hypothetical protein J2X79_003394 [Arthrobacter globiformis]|nr:hypothetical protein [Arthrobacter globiformis]
MSAISTGVLLSNVGGYDEGFLALAEFGLFATAPAFGFRELHAFTGPGPDEVGFEFCDHCNRLTGPEGS